MPTVMTKYKFNGKNYLVYTHNILAKEFNSSDWEKISDYTQGVGADFIAVFAGSDVRFYNAFGQQIEANVDLELVLAYHEHQQVPAGAKIERSIEVRLTNSFVNSLKSLKARKAFIA